MRLAVLFLPLLLPAQDWSVIEHRRIWSEPQHAAFGDLIRFDNRWFAVFREGRTHAPSPGKPDDGKLRVISSTDGASWKSEALLLEDGVDLRDPHLSLTPDDRLMIVCGGSYYPEGVYKGRQSRVFFSPNGSDWTVPSPVVAEGHWLWRVTWHNGRAYGSSKYGSPSAELKDNPRRQRLVTSRNGLQWTTVAELNVPGGDETTLRFLPDGRAAALMRNSSEPGAHAWVGTSSPPYTNWQWKQTSHFLGGPNFIVLPDGRWIAGGRLYPNADRSQPYPGLGLLTPEDFRPVFRLTGSGDASYPGLVWHDGILWVLYYASHEGKTSIYLAKLRLNP
jgi:hypothetical protein